MRYLDERSLHFRPWIRPDSASVEKGADHAILCSTFNNVCIPLNHQTSIWIKSVLQMQPHDVHANYAAFHNQVPRYRFWFDKPPQMIIVDSLEVLLLVPAP